MTNSSLSSVYAAIVTPFDDTGRPDYDHLTDYLRHLSHQGCHGVLAAGTTGEGPSLSVAERTRLFSVVKQANNDLRLLAGTGAASLDEATLLTQAAFDSGAEGVVIIPPFFYSNPPLEGLIEFYSRLITASVPSDGAVLLYHNPAVSAPPIDIELIARLRDLFPSQLIGIKDSGSDWHYTETIVKHFVDFQVFVGNDRFFAQALQAGAAGAVTALAGIFPALARDVFDAYEQNKPIDAAQERLTDAHRLFDGLPRIAAFKWLLKTGKLLETDHVRPPLVSLSEEEITLLKTRFHLDLPMPHTIDMADMPPVD